MKINLNLRMFRIHMELGVGGFIILLLIFCVFGDESLNGSERTDPISTENLNAEHNENDNLNTQNKIESHIKFELSEIGIENHIDNKLNVLETENSKSNTEEEKIEVKENESIEHLKSSNQNEIQTSQNYSTLLSKEENLSLREILKRLIPPQLSSIGDSDSTKETNDSLKGDAHKNEDLLSNSGSEAVNASGTDALNITESNSNNSANNSLSKKAVCLEIELLEDIGDVDIVNATVLQKMLQNNPNITTRSTAAQCYLVYFFSPYCPFSTQGSAYVNALARSIPNIQVVGLDSIEYHSLNARYGIMGTPSLVLFHNGNVAGRYNASEFSTFYLEAFIHHFTDQKINTINVTSLDFKSNLPSQTLVSPPYALYFAWTFLLACGGCLFLNSEFYAKLTEAVLNNWREAEAQHEHND